MQSAAHRGPCVEWRIPPSRCCAHAIRNFQHLRYIRRGSEVAAAAQEQATVFNIPESREEAVIVSVSALLSQIKGLSGTKKARKGFGGSGSSSTAPGTRFSIELPLPSDSPPELVELTGDILAKIPTAASAWTVFASEQAASAAAQNRVLQRSKVLSLQQACRVDSLNGPLLLVAPTTADVALVEQLLDEVWSGPWALLVNPSWHVNTPAQYQPLVGSFNTVYSFMPIATQGLMRVEGAVVHHVSPGSKGSSSSPWRVLVKEGEHFVQVGVTGCCRAHLSTTEVTYAFYGRSGSGVVIQRAKPVMHVSKVTSCSTHTTHMHLEHSEDHQQQYLAYSDL
eukprot:GHUV01037117.1.p1 GENE.GHUV01037117.1~~GHUV01037117.1.p1  ORF type:complete len:338 (+),score=109.67 GHUV01037117.1:124-1137(+)